ncbi:hypothetical protein Tco_1577726 [Tanacetum coccineum]
MSFNKEMKRVNTFVDIDIDLVKGSETRTEGSSKRAREELESKNLKKQKLDENVEAKVDDDQEEAETKKHMEIVPDDEVAIDAIPLATKPPIIVDWKIIKEGKMGYIQIIRADGSSKRPEEAYERVLWGDLKVMFEPDVESELWRNLQGHKVTVWKLFSSSGVHFMRFQIYISLCCVLTESYEGAWPEIRRHKSFDNVTADHLEGIMASPPPNRKKSLRGQKFTGATNFRLQHEMRLDAYETSTSYKERTKRWHDKRIKAPTNYEKGDKVIFDEKKLGSS